MEEKYPKFLAKSYLNLASIAKDKCQKKEFQKVYEYENEALKIILKNFIKIN